MENITKKLIIFLAVTILPNINKIRRVIYAVASISISFITMLFGFGMESSAMFKIVICIPVLIVNLIVLTASFSNVGITDVINDLNNNDNSNLNN